MAKLGSPKASHSASGKQAVAKIEREADSLKMLSKEGKCAAASIAHAEMNVSIGHAEAHMRSGGTGIWIPQTTIQEANHEWHEHCVRESRSLSGARKRRR